MKNFFARLLNAIVESRTRSAERYVKRVLGEEHLRESIKLR